jgi:hypothetical protein
MSPLQVIRNEFFHLLGGDHIAVNAQGVPIARAGSRAAVEQAAPDAAAYYSGADFEPAVPVAETDADLVAVFTPDPVLAPQTAPVDPEPLVVNVTGVSASATAKQNATVGQASSQMLGTSAFNNSAFNNMTNPQAPPAAQPPQDNDHVEPGAELFTEPTADPFQPGDDEPDEAA